LSTRNTAYSAGHDARATSAAGAASGSGSGKNGVTSSNDSGPLVQRSVAQPSSRAISSSRSAREGAGGSGRSTPTAGPDANAAP